MIDIAIHCQALRDRIDVIRALLRETHPVGQQAARGRVEREVRGLAIVLLFAAYENLLYGLTRTLLETASKLRVGNRRLQPTFRAFAVAGSADSLITIGQTGRKGRAKVFASALPTLMEVSQRSTPPNTINPDIFPDDGSYMKCSQILYWAAAFNILNPQLPLARVWPTIDTVVANRNAIAHGRLTPQEVGRDYSISEIFQLVDDWEDSWLAFLDHVALAASNRDFFRLPQ